MNPIVAKHLSTLQQLFSDLVELDKTDPGGVDLITSTIVNHIRSWRPASLTSETTNPFVKE